eukprot:2619156-Pyramimonas_sp.AAC.1
MRRLWGGGRFGLVSWGTGRSAHSKERSTFSATARGKHSADPRRRRRGSAIVALQQRDGEWE